MKTKYIIIVVVLISAVLVNKIVHDKRVEQIKKQFNQAYKENLLAFQNEYDSIATMLYDEDTRVAIQFEMLYNPSYFFKTRDTLINTILFNDFIKFNVYHNTFFDYFRQVSEIDVANERTLFNIKEGIHRISDEFESIGDEWRFKMINDELERFYEEEDFEIAGEIIDDSLKSTFHRTQYIKKTNCIFAYRAFLNYYKKTMDDQLTENIDNIYDWLYVMDWANENLYNYQIEILDKINEPYMSLDSISINHTYQNNIIGNIYFTTYKWNIPNKVLREKIDSF